MNPQPLFCPNDACPSRGVQGAGNLRVHDSLRDRFRCTTCKKTFSGRQGTPFHGLKTEEKTVILVVTLLAFGCPRQAIVAAFGFNERTVKDWQDRAGAHCEQVHNALVTQQSMDLVQVQADEMRVRVQKRLVVWMAMALCVPTRLWLGGVLSPTRDKKLLCALANQVHACARFGPILLVSDGLKSYVAAWQSAFRTPVHTGKRGQPRLLAWPQVAIAQVLKWQQKGRVVGIRECRLAGDWQQIARLLPAGQVLSTAYIERVNATFRQRLCCLVRRTRALARQPQTLRQGMYLLGCVYNFCTPHQSLHQETERTPAMAAGLSGHIWSVGELLCYRVVPPSFVPKKRRGRKPKTQAREPKGAKRLVTV